MRWTDSTFRRLDERDGRRVHAFDCGERMQNAFLREAALRDRRGSISVTHLLERTEGIVAYLTLCADSVSLAPGERPRAVRWSVLPAVKVAQMAVDLRFQRMGVGESMLYAAARIAASVDRSVGVRFLTVEALDERLVRWYEGHGFVRNLRAQEIRREEAVRRGRDPDAIAIGLRLDLRDGGT